jgi:hypothetical protein
LVIFRNQKEVRINRTRYMDVRIFGYFWKPKELRINRTRFMDVRIFGYFWKPKGSPQVRDVWGTLISTTWFLGSLEQ